MWSVDQEMIRKSSCKNNNSCSSRTSTRSCSSSTNSVLPPPPAPPPGGQPGLITRRRSMEEVWNDIAALPAAFTPSTCTPSIIIPSGGRNSNNSLGGHQIQDLLAGAFKLDAAASGRGGDTGGLGRSRSNWIPLQGTALRLSSSALDLRSSNSSSVSSGAAPLLQQHPSNNADDSTGGLFSISFSCSPKKMRAEVGVGCCSPEDGIGGGVGRRLKRMMKNRESAARSRARKQAYTNELEMEVAHLMKENAKLTKQLHELVRPAMASQPPTKKAKLQRTSTAPF